MQIKNNIILFFLVIFNLCFLNNNLSAEEFNISATEISFDNENNVLTGKGSVLITDKQGRVIKANKVEYKKTKEFRQRRNNFSVIPATNIQKNHD